MERIEVLQILASDFQFQASDAVFNLDLEEKVLQKFLSNKLSIPV